MSEVLRFAGTIAPFVVLAGLVGFVVWARVRRWDARVPPPGYLYEVDPHATRAPASASWDAPQPNGQHHGPGQHHGGGGHHTGPPPG